MSRSRNIKPGFFKNEVLVQLPFEQRLLFIGLWTVADRAGRFEDRPTKIKLELFPADDVDVDAGLEALHDNGFILRYSCNGGKYCQVLAWAKHQNPHCKEVASTIPAPCEHGASTMPAPEIPVRAGLIPDSQIPDSQIPDFEISPPPSKEVLGLKTARARETSPKAYDPDVGDAIDRRKLAEASKKIELQLAASVGSGSSPSATEIFEWECEFAGISVARGLEVQARGKKWPQTQTMGASP
jgi:hypothetical protein